MGGQYSDYSLTKLIIVVAAELSVSGVREQFSGWSFGKMVVVATVLAGGDLKAAVEELLELDDDDDDDGDDGSIGILMMETTLFVASPVNK